MLLAGSPPDSTDEIVDLDGDSAWDMGNSTNANAPSGGSSSKPMTEEEQKVSVALQERIAINVNRLGTHALNTVEGKF